MAGEETQLEKETRKGNKQRKQKEEMKEDRKR